MKETEVKLSEQIWITLFFRSGRKERIHSLIAFNSKKLIWCCFSSTDQMPETFSREEMKPPQPEREASEKREISGDSLWIGADGKEDS